MIMTNAAFARRPAAFALLFAVLARATLAAGSEEPPRHWEVTAGAGVASVPKYLGSEDTWTRPFPQLGARYGRFVFGDVPGANSPASVGIHLVETARWSAGAFVYHDLGDQRQESRANHLRGLGNVEASAQAGLFASVQAGWLVLRASARSDIGGRDQGTSASFEAAAQFPLSSRLFLAVGPSITWADSAQMGTFFSIDATQSAASGLAEYSAGPGVQSLGFSMAAMYQVSQRWGVGARVAAMRLQQEATRSAIVEDATQVSSVMFLSYRF
jgi:outer membrane protein